MLLLIGGTLALVFLDLPWSAVVIVVLAAVEVFEFRLWMWARRARPRAGTEGMVGERGTLLAANRVQIRGTSYPADVLDGSPGDRVVVERSDGIRLTVRKASDDEV
ncbi:MAG TPA: NfeD family protein [Actinomycetota bacterium]|nr:NfeD family protein [Actinomycetota bacterium]